MEREEAMKIIIVTLAMIATGCAMSPQRVSKMDDRKLCNEYHAVRDEWTLKKNLPLIRSEIESRNLVKPDEWDIIDQKKVRLGMSICALRASWGAAKENSTLTRYGSRIQHVYRLSWCHRCNVQYVYTENGVVTAIQD
jgi:hypothetical protein